MLRRTVVSLFFIALWIASGHALGSVRVVVGVAPPAPMIDTPPPGAYALPPHRGAIWIPGLWVRHGGGWVWIGGRRQLYSYRQL